MEENNFTHTKAEISDKIRLIGELEHIRSHALRSSVVAMQGDDKENATSYFLTANAAKMTRRALMQKWFPETDPKDWCLCKSAASLRQIAYEIWGCDKAMDLEDLKTIDELTDQIWGKALGKDMSDCVSCKEDMGDI